MNRDQVASLLDIEQNVLEWIVGLNDPKAELGRLTVWRRDVEDAIRTNATTYGELVLRAYRQWPIA